MMDHAPSSGILDRWGLVRNDGTGRPALRAFQVATRYLTRPGVIARLAPYGTADANGWPVTRVLLDEPGERTRVQVLWRSAAGPASVQVETVGGSAAIVDVLGGSRPAQRVGDAWEVPLPPSRVPQAFDPPGFQSVGYPVLLVETDLPAGKFFEPARVSSSVMALAPAVLEAPRPSEAVARPPLPALAPAAALAPMTQPGPTLVLSVANPQPEDLVPHSGYAMQGVAYDRNAGAGSGVDRVAVFLGDRDNGGQHLGDAKLGEPQPGAFALTVDFSKSSGQHSLFVYARSAVSGKETVVNFPITIATR
jgi:hypothetical protein